MSYYLRIRGKAFGPFSEEQMQEMKMKGKISRSGEVSENRVDWVAASEYEFLYPKTSGDTGGYGIQGGGSSAGPPGPASWFYSTDGNTGYGPFPEAHIVQMIRTGTLTATSYVWQQGGSASEISTVSTFATHFGGGGTGQQHGNNRPDDSNGTSHSSQQSIHGIGWFFEALKKYADFTGRSRRLEFWTYTLYTSLLAVTTVCLYIAIAFCLLSIDEPIILYLLYLLYCFASFGTLLLSSLFLPSLAVTVRRLHDTGRSGGWYFLSFIPVVGALILIIFLAEDSRPQNQYGPRPK